MKEWIVSREDSMDEINQYIRQLEQENARLREALEFYADIDSWHHMTTESIKYYVVDISDIGEGEFDNGNGVDDCGVGGKRARQTLKGKEE